MIKSLKVTNHLNESILLELGHPEKSGLLVREITGIGMSSADINMTEMSMDDGSVYNYARTTSRNIVISLKFMDAPTIEDSRYLSYKYFPLKKMVKLLFETDNRISEIIGYVESNTPNIFSKDSGTQISIICPDPYFYSIFEDHMTFSGVDALFEFPFSNESLTEPLIEFGAIRNDTFNTIYYSGDEPVGVLIKIHANASASNIAIYNVDTRESMLINIDLIARDDLIISTVHNDKYIYLLRDGEVINAISNLKRGSDWFKITTGDNLFAYSAEVGEEDLMFDIKNAVLYGGI